MSLPAPEVIVSPPDPPVNVTAPVLLEALMLTALVIVDASIVARPVALAMALVMVKAVDPVIVNEVISLAVNVVMVLAPPLELMVSVS